MVCCGGRNIFPRHQLWFVCLLLLVLSGDLPVLAIRLTLVSVLWMAAYGAMILGCIRAVSARRDAISLYFLIMVLLGAGGTLAWLYFSADFTISVVILLASVWAISARRGPISLYILTMVLLGAGGTLAWLYFSSDFTISIVNVFAVIPFLVGCGILIRFLLIFIKRRTLFATGN
jgi:hypothetical protein